MRLDELREAYSAACTAYDKAYISRESWQHENGKISNPIVPTKEAEILFAELAKKMRGFEAQIKELEKDLQSANTQIYTTDE